MRAASEVECLFRTFKEHQSSAENRLMIAAVWFIARKFDILLDACYTVGICRRIFVEAYIGEYPFIDVLQLAKYESSLVCKSVRLLLLAPAQ